MSAENSSATSTAARSITASKSVWWPSTEITWLSRVARARVCAV
jgi:hypothetical protein